MAPACDENLEHKEFTKSCLLSKYPVLFFRKDHPLLHCPKNVPTNTHTPIPSLTCKSLGHSVYFPVAFSFPVDKPVWHLSFCTAPMLFMCHTAFH